MKQAINLVLLRRLIKKGGWKTEGFANEIGITRATLSAILNGQRLPGYMIMKEIYRALKLTPQQADALFFNSNLHLT